MGQKGPTAQEQATQQEITQGQLGSEQQQQAQSSQLYNLTEPGLQTAENYYKQLASGNPQSIQTATAPATEAIAGNYNQAVKNIQQNMPRGGAQDLAVQEAEISKAGAIGGTQAQAYLGAPTALANLAQGGIGLSVNEMTQALSAFSGASSSNTSAANMSGAGKAETLGFLGSLGQSAATGAGLAIGCWIAIVLWGEFDCRTIRLRCWLHTAYNKTLVGSVVVWLYDRYGERVAKYVERYKWLRLAFTPIFEMGNRAAIRWEQQQGGIIRHASVA